ncbi:hypothetical protein BAUCODRAFT_144394 [Baudoinia panamericana UAMH 10762]|uniref:Mediator complex subunit 15 KIX domain-containing protein n=1 Tax=Baudoinia panamericana (strain UAMH 10762) TaxID=717646 RepID=M2NNG2_BAUPA|nr:uncharacterized protein BAUCODRAFT_144394 [Baudoinia panamericana UAMH 10762]EMD00776.1 hypothetical protein BAUCODRAFT_144394 [Baudoinia panamericana UAMH 10762]
MEQPNLMPMNGMMPQNMNSMQRPQSGNHGQQIYAQILTSLRERQAALPQGWQRTFDMGQRAGITMQIVTQLRMLQPGVDLAQTLKIAQSWELRTMQESGNQEQYRHAMSQKMSEIAGKRAAQAQAQSQALRLQGTVTGASTTNMDMLANNNNMMGMNMSNSGMGMPNGAPMNGNFGGQQPNNALSHLQQPMVPSPIPPPQQNVGIDPAALSNTGGPPQMQANANSLNPQQMQQMQREIFQMAQAMMQRTDEATKEQLRTNFVNSLTEQARNEILATGQDPLHRFYIQKAKELHAKKKADQQIQMQNRNGLQQSSNGQQAMNLNVPGQQPMSQGAPTIDLSTIIGQQAHALKQQETGGEVVPASNNTSFDLADMNMPQGINPQMLGNPNGQPQNNNPQLQQLLMQQQRIQQQNMMARQQALQQQQQLRGQPGGLNAPNALNGGPAGQINSPAMSMLNRPMVPPGQQGTPNTPQSNRMPPNQPPQTPMNPAAQLLQHHQQMLNQGTSGGTQGLQQPQQPQISRETFALLQSNKQTTDSNQFKQMWAKPDLQQQFLSMPLAKQQELLHKMAGRMGPFGVVNGGQQPSQQQPGMQPNMNPQGQPSNMGNNAPRQMIPAGTPVRQFNSHPPPNQQMQTPNMPDSGDMQQRLQQQQQNHAMSQFRQKALDLRPFPRSVLSQLGLAVTDNVRVWGQLKNHINQKQDVIPPQTMQKVQALQNQWFEQHPEEISMAVQQLQRIQQQKAQQQAGRAQQQAGPSGAPGQPQVSGPPNMQMPNGQAPPAQMVPPTAPMQAPNQGQPISSGQMPQLQQLVSPQEIQEARSKFSQMSSMTDEQIRDILGRRRREQQLAMKAQQEALRNAQLQNAQMMRAQAQMQGAPSSANQPNQRGQQPVRQHQANQQPASLSGKRPPQSNDNDDVVEIPNPNAPAAQMSVAPQAPPMQQRPSQQGNPLNMLRAMSKEQQTQYMASLGPEEKKRMFDNLNRQRMQAEAIKKAQMGLPNNESVPPPTQARTQQQQQQPTPPQQPTSGPQQQQQLRNAQVIQKLQAMMAEVERANPKGPPVQMDDASFQQVASILKRLAGPVRKMTQPFAMGLTHGAGLPNIEERVRAAMAARTIIMQNTDEHGNMLGGQVSLDLQRLKQLETDLNSYFGELRSLQENRKAQAQQQQQRIGGQQAPNLVQTSVQAQVPQKTPAPSKPQAQSQAPPVASAAPQHSQARKSSRPPPAPTDDKKFDWGAPSPHGVPKYDSGRNELTPDKLKFPPNKKRKTGQPESQASTPAAQMGTPGAVATVSPIVTAGKVPSPEQSRKVQLQQVDTEGRQFRCKDALCEASIKGFETEELLKKHEEVQHAPVADPLAFLLENAAKALSVDQDGHPLPQKVPVKSQPRSLPAAKPAVKREGQTPNVKQEAVTPQQPSAAKAKAKATAEAAEPAAPEEEKTLREVIEERMGFKPETPQPAAAGDSALDTVPRREMDDNMFSELVNDAFAGDDWAGVPGFQICDFAEIPVENWGIQLESESSPELSPSNSEGSRPSDVSENDALRLAFQWDAFGNGDTLAPDVLMKTQKLRLSGSPALSNASKEVDTACAAKPQEEPKKDQVEDEWDWSGDMTDFQSMFPVVNSMTDMNMSL